MEISLLRGHRRLASTTFPNPSVKSSLPRLISQILFFLCQERKRYGHLLVELDSPTIDKLGFKQPATNGLPVAIFLPLEVVMRSAILLVLSFLCWLPGRPARAVDQGQPTIALQAKKVLETYCAKCHGPKGTNRGGFRSVLDRQKLVDDHKIAPGDPVKSTLFQRLVSANNPMPPRDHAPRPSKEEIALVQKWIQEGAPDFARAVSQRQHISMSDVVTFIEHDLRKTVKEEHRPFTRYFLLTNLYNAGVPDEELEIYRNGLSKLVNSLSWKPKISAPRAIDPAKTVFRIDLRHYGWTAQTWQRILAGTAYTVIPTDQTAAGIYKATQCELPFVRADAFAFAASKAPLYYDLLQFPATSKELEEKELKLNVADNISSEEVIRVGFTRSDIAKNNRLIERHQTGYGAYWISYDFSGNTKDKDLFQRPLGPGNDKTAFHHEASEIIFNLPNGLQAYLIVDREGNRTNEALPNLVTDRNRPDRPITAGVSCMQCHKQGINPKDDEIRDSVLATPQAFPDKKVRETILALYKPQEVLARTMVEDSERFRQAVKATGTSPDGPEPISALAQRFEDDLDVRALAAEVDRPVEEFVKELKAQSPKLVSVFRNALAGKTVNREVFAGEFRELAELFQLGTPLPPRKVAVNSPAPKVFHQVLVENVVKEEKQLPDLPPPNPPEDIPANPEHGK